MSIVAVDIDDTLYSFTSLAREKFSELAMEKGDKTLLRGAYCSWAEWRSPADVIDLPHWLEIIDMCHTDNEILEATPFKDAASVLWRLVDAGHTLIYISNRRPTAHEATHEWLHRNGFPGDPAGSELICTAEDKMPLVAHCQYIIDDRPKTLVQFVYEYNWKNKWGSINDEKQRVGFGLFGEYNRSLTDIPGVYLAPNWKLLEHYMEEKSDLFSPLCVS